jgi:hypothetical protein
MARCVPLVFLRFPRPRTPFQSAALQTPDEVLWKLVVHQLGNRDSALPRDGIEEIHPPILLKDGGIAQSIDGPPLRYPAQNAQPS